MTGSDDLPYHRLLPDLVDHIPGALLLADRDGLVHHANSAARRLLQLPLPPTSGWHIDELLHTLSRPGGDLLLLSSLLRQLSAEPQHHVLTMGHGDDLRWLDVQLRQLPDELGRQYLLIAIQDTTEEHQTRYQCSYLSAILEATSDAVIGLDHEDRIRSWNAGACGLYGYPSETAIGQHVSLLLDNHQEASQAAWEEAQQCLTVDAPAEATHRHRDGDALPVQVRLMPLTADPQQPIRCALVIHDLSAQKELEAQLHHALKLDSIGQLASGVAHDFNNLLTVILGQSEMIHRSRPGDDLHDRVSQIIQATTRAKALTGQLLAFSRKTAIAPCPVDLNHQLEQLGKMIRRLIGEDIDLSFELSPHLPTIKIDPTQLDQIVINLVVNARDAIPSNGQITLGTDLQEVTPEAADTLGLPPGSYVQFFVRDNGSGMSPDLRQRIFEPFFTTKEAGKGTGLGLSMVRQIMQQVEGHIRVEGQLGQGSTFYLSFPTCGEPLEGEELHEPPAPYQLRGQHLLLVEDEDNLRGLCQEILEDAGFRVSLASTGPEALRQLDRHADDIALVVTDLVMPGTNVEHYITALSQRLGPRRTLYVTGFADRYDRVLPELREKGCYLQKPFSPRQLIQAIQELL